MAASRERLIKTGVDIATRGGAESLVRVLRTEAICAEAGLSRRTFYDQFETSSEFCRAVSEAMRTIPRTDSSESFDLDGALASGADLANIVEAIFDRFADSSAIVARARFWDPGVEAPARNSIDLVLAAIEEAGFRPTTDLECMGVGDVLEALFHACATGALALADLVAATITMLTSAYVRLDVTAQVDSAAAALTAELRASRLHPAGDLVLNLRRLVIDATLDVIEQRGLDHATLDDIAQRVGISAGTIAVTMGSVVDLASAGLDELTFALIPPMQADVAEGLTRHELLVRHAGRLTTLLGSRPRLCELVILTDSRGDARPLEALTEPATLAVDPSDTDKLERATLVLATLSRRGETMDPQLFSHIAIAPRSTEASPS
ncbi:MAG: TetR family transcriptional regulator [bacterium]|nr:TetR family transcriptional regulator [bacterium]